MFDYDNHVAQTLASPHTTGPIIESTFQHLTLIDFKLIDVVWLPFSSFSFHALTRNYRSFSIYS